MAVAFIKESLLVKFLTWYFWRKPGRILSAWKNFLRFGWNYFSIGLLFKTFFDYWHRYKWSYGRGFDPKKWIEAASFNLISRILGMIVRAVFIVLGVAFETVIFVFGLIVFLGWFALPLFIVGLFVVGFELLFNQSIAI